MNAGMAIALAYATLLAVQAVASPGLSDGLAMPGAVIGSAGGIVGLYDIPSGSWAAVCIAGNLLFYSALWWMIISFIARRRRLSRDHTAAVVPSNTSLERTRER